MEAEYARQTSLAGIPAITKDEFLGGENGLPRQVEWVRGMVGPFSDEGIRTLVANWGADRVIAATGVGIWREALEAIGKDDS